LASAGFSAANDSPSAEYSSASFSDESAFAENDSIATARSNRIVK